MDERQAVAAALVRAELELRAAQARGDGVAVARVECGGKGPRAARPPADGLAR